jgi:hypothetical protein
LQHDEEEVGDEDEEVGDEDEEEVPSSEQQGSERPRRLWVRGGNKLPDPPKTEAEKIRLVPTKKE